MAIFSKQFKVIKKDEDDNTSDFSFGHMTSVRRQETLNGDIVVKQMNAIKEKNPVLRGANLLVWLGRQQDGKKIADEIRKKNNPAYFVPRTFIAHGKVREQFASGQLWRDVIATMSQEDKEWAYKALAEFVNDMSELRPVQHLSKEQSVARIGVKSSEEMTQILDGVDEKYLDQEDKQLIQDVYDYLSQIPENNLMVFGHNDLHGGNIIIDLEKKKLSIIDFELSGYRTAFEVMYSFGPLKVPEFWEYINKLPRSTNPNLNWTFVLEHAQLHQFLTMQLYNIRGPGNYLQKHNAEIKRQCMSMRLVLAQAKLKAKEMSKKQKMALVPVSEKFF